MKQLRQSFLVTMLLSMVGLRFSYAIGKVTVVHSRKGMNLLTK